MINELKSKELKFLSTSLFYEFWIIKMRSMVNNELYVKSISINQWRETEWLEL